MPSTSCSELPESARILSAPWPWTLALLLLSLLRSSLCSCPGAWQETWELRVSAGCIACDRGNPCPNRRLAPPGCRSGRFGAAPRFWFQGLVGGQLLRRTSHGTAGASETSKPRASLLRPWLRMETLCCHMHHWPTGSGGPAQDQVLGRDPVWMQGLGRGVDAVAGRVTDTLTATATHMQRVSKYQVALGRARH